MPRKKKPKPGPDSQTVSGKKIAHTTSRTPGSTFGAEGSFIRKHTEPLVNLELVRQITLPQQGGRVPVRRPKYF